MSGWPASSSMRCDSHARFTPESGHVQCHSACLLCAISGDSVGLDHMIRRKLADPCIAQFDLHRWVRNTELVVQLMVQLM
jgi:hypothetical protein